MLFASCSRQNYVYRAPMIQANVFETKGDVYASFGVNQLPGLSAGYAITDHIGVVAGLYGEQFEKGQAYEHRDSNGVNIGSAIYNRQRNGLQLAGVYYGNRGKFRYELQAGFGVYDELIRVKRTGDLTGSAFDFNRNISRVYQTVLVQPALGIQDHNLEVMLGVRIQRIGYEMQVTPYADLLAEPFVQVKAGWDHLKFSLQAGTMYATDRGQFRYYPIHIGAGLVFNLNVFGRLKSY
ncbi:MAG: hypothetical protein ACK417_07430 [Bacteroidia bacterium]